MSNIATNSGKLKNIESLFTELFSLLKRYEYLPNGSATLAYQSHELKAMNQYIDNTIDVLLQSLQNSGQVMSLIAQNKKEISEDISNLGFFMAAIGNLTEVLTAVRLDASDMLRQRKEADD